MRKWIRYLAVLSVVAMIAAACGGDGETGGGGTDDETGAPVDKIPVSVHFQGALTGDYNYLVISAFNAAQIRFNELNAEEDFPAEVTLVQGDTQGDGEQAGPVVEAAVTDPNTVAVIGPAFSGESEASGDGYNDAQIPFVSPSATNPGLADQGWDYWYRGVANDEDQGTPAAQYMARTLGLQNVFVLHDKSTYGQGIAEVVQSVLEEEGATVAGFAGSEAGTEDYSAVISDVQASGADGLFFGGYDADFGKIVAQARDAGLDVPMMSGDGSVSSTLVDLAGDALTDVHLSCPCNLEGAGDFLAKYEAEYGGGGVPVYAAEGYDVASLIGEGIRSAVDGGAEDPVAMREGIKEYLDGLTTDAPFEGVAKTYAFDPDTHELAAENRLELIYLYEAEPGQINLVGSAAEVVEAA